MHDIDPKINSNRKHHKLESKLLKEKIMNRSLRLGLSEPGDLIKFQKSVKSGFNQLCPKQIPIWSKS